MIPNILTRGKAAIIKIFLFLDCDGIFVDKMLWINWYDNIVDFNYLQKKRDGVNSGGDVNGDNDEKGDMDTDTVRL